MIASSANNSSCSPSTLCSTGVGTGSGNSSPFLLMRRTGASSSRSNSMLCPARDSAPGSGQLNPGCVPNEACKTDSPGLSSWYSAVSVPQTRVNRSCNRNGNGNC